VADTAKKPVQSALALRLFETMAVSLPGEAPGDRFF